MKKLLQLIKEILLEFGPSGNGYFLNKKTGQYYDVRPQSHSSWAMKNFHLLGVPTAQIGSMMDDPMQLTRYAPDWMRVSKFDSHMTVDTKFPLTSRDIDVVKDFVMDARIMFDTIMFVDPISKRQKWAEYHDFEMARSGRDSQTE